MGELSGPLEMGNSRPNPATSRSSNNGWAAQFLTLHSSCTQNICHQQLWAKKMLNTHSTCWYQSTGTAQSISESTRSLPDMTRLHRGLPWPLCPLWGPGWHKDSGLDFPSFLSHSMLWTSRFKNYVFPCESRDV